MRPARYRTRSSKWPKAASPTAIRSSSCLATRPAPPASSIACVSAASKIGWVHKAIDSRDCALPNKELIAEWIETYGVDSDFVRVRVRGLPPAADELQFIDRERIKEAQKREAQSLADDPLICGVDVSGGGAAWNVVAFRRGGGCAHDAADPHPRRTHARSQCAGGQAGRDPARHSGRVARSPPCSSTWPSARRSTNACAPSGSTTSSRSTSG